VWVDLQWNERRDREHLKETMMGSFPKLVSYLVVSLHGSIQAEMEY